MRKKIYWNVHENCFKKFQQGKCSESIEVNIPLKVTDKKTQSIILFMIALNILLYKNRHVKVIKVSITILREYG